MNISGIAAMGADVADKASKHQLQQHLGAESQSLSPQASHLVREHDMATALQR